MMRLKPSGRKHWRDKKGVSTWLASLLGLDSRQQRQETSRRQAPSSTTSRRIYGRAKARPAFSAWLVALSCLLVSGAFLTLLAQQVLPLAIGFAALIGWVAWKTLKGG
ncbi:MAG: hypothetical protein ABIH46_12955 [Chloroflexota bacterium]